MPKPKPYQELGRRDRWVVTVVPGLVGLACAAVTLLCAIGIGSELSGWVRSLGWASTPAQIEQNDLRRKGPKSGPWTLVVRYHYWVDDTRYEGTRVGWNDSAWVGQAWRKERFHDLVDAGNSGRPVLVWYDPKDPAAAVLDRRLRWGLLLFLLPAGLFSGLLAWAAAWLVRKRWRQLSRALRPFATRPLQTIRPHGPAMQPKPPCPTSSKRWRRLPSPPPGYATQCQRRSRGHQRRITSSYGDPSCGNMCLQGDTRLMQHEQAARFIATHLKRDRAFMLQHLSWCLPMARWSWIWASGRSRSTTSTSRNQSGPGSSNANLQTARAPCASMSMWSRPGNTVSRASTPALLSSKDSRARTLSTMRRACNCARRPAATPSAGNCSLSPTVSCTRIG